MNPYFKFAAMMATSFVIMYAVMFANVDTVYHIYLSPTRYYMTLLMVAPMAFTMLLFMWKMYPSKLINYAILTGAVLVFGLSYAGLRQQAFIADVAWMEAMIPHHSSAIMVSEKATFNDPEAKQLAEEIIKSQRREIDQMKEMMHRLKSQ